MKQDKKKVKSIKTIILIIALIIAIHEAAALTTPHLIYGQAFYENGTIAQNATINISIISLLGNETLLDTVAASGWYNVDLGNLANGYKDRDEIEIVAYRGLYQTTAGTTVDTSVGGQQIENLACQT